jgi:3,4-dihydroxy 2-butanone 4-phosphate synthase / GTP cyclohydrolase II
MTMQTENTTKPVDLELDSPFVFDTIEDALNDIRQGKILVVVDDENRENEGDFICAAESVTPELINFMATHGRGLICTPITEQRAEELSLRPMASDNTALHETAFTVSIDLLGQGCSTGISAYDRSTGIRAMIDPKIVSRDFARPGHIFPLRAKDGGVLRRPGHTEAAVDLARLAGLYPAGVLVEILNEDGSMARLPQLIEVAKKHQLRIITIDDLVEYRMRTERLVKKTQVTKLETPFGAFDLHVYEQLTNGDTHFALTMGHWAEEEPVLVRAHSANVASEVFYPLLGNDINSKSLQHIAQNGAGCLLYLRQTEKSGQLDQILKEFSEVGDVNLLAHARMDIRDFGIGAQILHDLGIRHIRALTQSASRTPGALGFGLTLVENVVI